MTWTDAAARFRDLHAADALFILPNAWDVMTARAFERCGFAALGTTSFGIDRAHGFVDGSNASFAETVAVARRIATALAIPLTVDFEAGFSDDPGEVRDNAAALVDAGAVGVNIEDAAGAPASLCEKIAAIKSIRTPGPPLFVNARIDVYWLGLDAPANRFAETLDRAERYAAAGADGIFVPGLVDRASLATLVRRLRVPLNVLASPALPDVDELAEIGVRRLSTGSGPARATLGLLARIGADLLRTGTSALLEDAPSYEQSNRP